MTLTDLKRYIIALETEHHATSAPVSMQERLEQAFAHRVIERLQSILSHDEATFTQLTILLHEMWRLVNGTCLSATASPQSIGTRALIATAEYIAADMNHHPCPVITMNASPCDASVMSLSNAHHGLVRAPRETRHVLIHQDTPPAAESLLTHDCSVGYVRLREPNALYYINQSEKKRVRLALQQDTLAAFDLASAGIGEGEALPSEALKIIQAQPSHPKWSPLFYVNKQRDEVIGLNPTAEQLRSIDAHSTENPASVPYPEVQQVYPEAALFNPLGLMMPTTLLPEGDMPVQQILNTHIRGTNGLYLVPVSVLKHLTLDSTRIRLLNPAYHERLDPALAYLSLDEISRIEAHSTLTENLFTAKRQYNALTEDRGHLLGQLRRFDNLLEINDAHSGHGTEVNAASGAYPAIIDFMSYYRRLNRTQIELIPKGLQDEIELLLNYASNPSMNSNASTTFGTCIGTRRKELKKQVTGKEVLLSTISINPETQSELIEEAITRFYIAKADLIQAIENNTYLGRDHLGITQELMERLGVQWRIFTLEELKLVTELSTADMIAALENPDLKSQVMQQLSNLESLIVLILETPPKKIGVFLKAMKRELSSYIDSLKDFSALLISLDVEKTHIVLRVFLAKLRSLLRDSNGLGEILHHLSPEQCTIVLAPILGRLPHLCATNDDIRRLLLDLSPEQCVVVLTALQNELPSFCSTAYDVSYFLCHLSPQQGAALLTLINSKLRSIFFNVDAIDVVLSAPRLNPKQIPQLLVAIQGLFSIRLNTVRDVNNILRYLSLPSQRLLVLSAIKDKLSGLCSTSENVRDVVYHLRTQEEYRFFLTAIESELPRICATANDIRWVLHYLLPKNRTTVFNLLKDTQLVTVLYNEPTEADKWLGFLLPAEQKELYNLLATRLSDEEHIEDYQPSSWCNIS